MPSILNVPVVYCNLVGGQDELVFDGRSMVPDAAGQAVAEAAEFEEDLLIVDIEKKADGLSSYAAVFNPADPRYDAVAEVYQALVLGTRDYVRKNGFSKSHDWA